MNHHPLNIYHTIPGNLGRDRTYAFGVYIGHKICHHVLATSVTLLSQPDITMSEGPKDQLVRQSQIVQSVMQDC